MLVAALVGVGAYAVVAGDDGGADAPEQAVRDYLTAEANHDCERVVALLSERVTEQSGGRQEAIDSCEDRRDGEEDDISDEDLATLLDSVETTAVRGDRATVTYTAPGEMTDELDPITIEITLVNEDSAWKVDDLVPVAGDLPEDSPLAAARDHAQAVLDQDCEAFLAVLTEEAQTELGTTPEVRMTECERLLGQGTFRSDARLGPVIRESQEDGVAVVGITIFSERYEAGNNIFYVTVVEEDGVWKVDQLDWSDDPD